MPDVPMKRQSLSRFRLTSSQLILGGLQSVALLTGCDAHLLFHNLNGAYLYCERYLFAYFM